MSLDIPLLTVIIFLLFTLVIFFCSLRKKSTSFQEHAVGHKQFTTPTLVATILACYYAGPTLRMYIDNASFGILWIVHRIFVAVCPLLIISWLARRMSKFIYDVSMPSTIGRVYGNYPRLITALFEIFYAIVSITFQIRSISDAISLFITSTSPILITILTTAVLVTYSVFGGIRAITFTDVWQSITFFTLIGILVWVIFKEIGQPVVAIIDCIQTKENFQLGKFFDLNKKLPITFQYLSTMFIAIAPPIVHSLYMSSSTTQAKKVFLYASIFSFIMTIGLLLVGLFAFVWAENFSSKAGWGYFIAAASPPLKGLVCISMLAMAMSTVDTRLHVASVIIAHDMPKIITRLDRFVYPYRISIARIAMLVIALVAMVLAFCTNFETGYMVLMWYGRVYVPVIVAPFILAILGLRATSGTALIGMITGLLSVFAWQKWVSSIVGTNSGHVPCMLLNGLVMIAIHYISTQQKKVRE